MSAIDQYNTPHIEPRYPESQLTNAGEKMRPDVAWQNGVSVVSGLTFALAAYTGVPIVLDVLHAVWPSIAQLAIAAPSSLVAFAAVGYDLINRGKIYDSIASLRRGPEDLEDDRRLRKSAKKHLRRLSVANFTIAASGTLAVLGICNNVDLRLIIPSSVALAAGAAIAEDSGTKLGKRLKSYLVPKVQ